MIVSQDFALGAVHIAVPSVWREFVEAYGQVFEHGSEEAFAFADFGFCLNVADDHHHLEDLFLFVIEWAAGDLVPEGRMAVGELE